MPKGGEATSLVITQPKAQLEKPELRGVWEGEMAAWSPYLTSDELWWRRKPKAVEAEFPLISPRYTGANLTKGKERRAADWDELREWRHLTVL